MDLVPVEGAVRLGCFLSVLVLMAGAEILLPRRTPTVARRLRWVNNLALSTLNTLVVRLMFPLGAVGVALVAEHNHWGLFPHTGWPKWVVIVLAVVLLDLVVYVQHVLFHAIPVLWSLHRVHHADLDFDVTTGIRFHPLEMILSMGIKIAVVMSLGVPPLAVLLFEVLLSSTSLFNHGNVRLPGWLDRVLRLVLVTPDMHRVHHSVESAETNSNFGFNLSWWDFLLGTYRAQPAAGHVHMVIGLPQERDERVERLPVMLLLPFQRAHGSSSVRG